MMTFGNHEPGQAVAEGNDILLYMPEGGRKRYGNHGVIIVEQPG